MGFEVRTNILRGSMATVLTTTPTPLHYLHNTYKMFSHFVFNALSLIPPPLTKAFQLIPALDKRNNYIKEKKREREKAKVEAFIPGSTKPQLRTRGRCFQSENPVGTKRHTLNKNEITFSELLYVFSFGR